MVINVSASHRTQFAESVTFKSEKPLSIRVSVNSNWKRFLDSYFEKPTPCLTLPLVLGKNQEPFQMRVIEISKSKFALIKELS